MRRPRAVGLLIRYHIYAGDQGIIRMFGHCGCLFGVCCSSHNGLTMPRLFPLFGPLSSPDQLSFRYLRILHDEAFNVSFSPSTSHFLITCFIWKL